MTTDRQRLANRANAKASTGPKSKAGKVRSAQNALRHGLNLPIWSDPELAPQAEAIARKIAGPNPNAEALDRARLIGEAQIDLNRVRARRTVLMTKLLGSVNYQSNSASKQKLLVKFDRRVLTPLDEEAIQKVTQLQNLKGDEKFTTILEDRASELARLDRYERRAVSRRKSAIRRFDAEHASAEDNGSAQSSPIEGDPYGKSNRADLRDRGAGLRTTGIRFRSMK